MKGDADRLIGRTKGGMNTTQHAVTDTNGQPLSFFLTVGPISDYTGTAALPDGPSTAKWLLAEHDWNAD